MENLSNHYYSLKQFITQALRQMQFFVMSPKRKSLKVLRAKFNWALFLQFSLYFSVLYQGHINM